jgi:hypothetical protein
MLDDRNTFVDDNFLKRMLSDAFPTSHFVCVHPTLSLGRGKGKREAGTNRETYISFYLLHINRYGVAVAQTYIFLTPSLVSQVW